MRDAERMTERVEGARMSQLRQIERRRVFSTLSEPADAIASLRRCAHFAALVRRHKPDLDGVTVLVPNDGAFLGQRGDRAEIVWS